MCPGPSLWWTQGSVVRIQEKTHILGLLNSRDICQRFHDPAPTSSIVGRFFYAVCQSLFSGGCSFHAQQALARQQAVALALTCSQHHLKHTLRKLAHRLHTCGLLSYCQAPPLAEEAAQSLSSRTTGFKEYARSLHQAASKSSPRLAIIVWLHCAACAMEALTPVMPGNGNNR